MAEDKKGGKGKWNEYTDSPVNMRDYYYDRDENDKDARNTFNDKFATLNQFNDKLKGELKKAKKNTLDLNYDEQENDGKGKDVNEGLMSKAKFFNDAERARKQFVEYKRVGGEAKTLESFLEKATKMVEDGKDVKSGKDVANFE